MENQALMLVDDDQLEHIKLKSTFKKFCLDCDIVSSYDGEEALDYLSNNKHQLPKLILLDLNMPKMNGIEFLETVKSDSIFKRIPVVVITTSNAADDRFACFDNQVAGYMLKPDDFDSYQDLISVITNYWGASKVAN